MPRLTVTELPSALPPSHLAVVIDVLRASTSIATALHSGATAVIPVATIAAARRAAAQVGNALLAGERNAVRIAGFNLGNSPLEYTPAAVRGRVIVTTTTNGTRALAAAAKTARDVIVGSYVNFSGVLASVRAALGRGLDVAIVCAGSEGHLSLEDTACAGRFVRLALRGLPSRATVTLNDAARAALLIEKPYVKSLARLFEHASHGRTLQRGGFAADLAACRALDTCPVVPRLVGRELRARSPRRAPGR